jgi:alpha-tubulin suppressor-like RCC1 family protein
MPHVTLLAVALTLFASLAAAAGAVEVWGDRVIPPPADLTGFVDVVSNGDHNAGLRADGSVFCWGGNQVGQCVVPDDLPPCVDLATGFNRTMAVTSGGAIVSWGWNEFGSSGFRVGNIAPVMNA